MNTIALAISSGVPMRLVGMCVSRKFALFCCVCAKWLNIRVSVGPGPTMLTRTPVPASSMAADFVMPSTACLLPTYIAAVGPPTLPYEDEMLTMLPLPCRSIISPGFVSTNFAEGVTNPEVKTQLEHARDKFALPPEAIARAIVFAIEQPSDVDVNEIIVRPTAQT